MLRMTVLEAVFGQEIDKRGHAAATQLQFAAVYLVEGIEGGVVHVEVALRIAVVADEGQGADGIGQGLDVGAGVAGLQAIATARRLGAIVTATDVRPATKEQVESLGAKFLAVEDEEFKQAQTAGGYAKEMSKDYQAKQAELTASHIAKQDIVITTALIPGRPAPRLITAEHVASMRPGSVIVDLAVEQGGNCAASRPGETVVTDNGVTVVGVPNLPGRIAADASALYAKNLLAFAGLLIKDGALAPDEEDEILKAALVAQGGAVTHPGLVR